MTIFTNATPALVGGLAASPGILEGPYAEITIGERHLEIYTRPGQSHRIDGKVHGKLLRQAAEQWTPDKPNPCLVPLDGPDEHGKSFVWGKITVTR